MRSNGKILLRTIRNLSKGLYLEFESTLKPQEKPHSEFIKRSMLDIKMLTTISNDRQRQNPPINILNGVTNLRNLVISRQQTLLAFAYFSSIVL